MAASDVVTAFLEHLVDPMLPAKASTGDSLAQSELEAVAQQVHSVVLLYNYYHRKQHPELEFLVFDEFCKLAVALRPNLLAHMKFTQTSDESKLVDATEQLSLTERKIMEACKICERLDSSKNVPSIGGWPISKVAVLLIDSKMESCLLTFGFITKGVWSLVEKDVDISSQSSVVTSGNTYTRKKRKIINFSKDEFNADEDEFLKVGYSALDEVTGFRKTDIMLLKSYTVYSHSKEKAASRFFIMKYSHLIKHEEIRVPIKDLVERLRGSMVEKISSCWTITPAVEYFHLLPYSEVISEWLSSATFSNSLQDSKLAEKNAVADRVEETESHVSSEGIYIGLDNRPGGDDIESLKQKENNGSCTVTQPGSTKQAPDVDVDNSSVFPSKSKEECQLIVSTLHVSEDQKIQNQSVQHHSNGSTSPIKVEKVDPTMVLITEGGIKNQSASNKICDYTTSGKDIEEEFALIANYSYSDTEKLHILLDSKGEALSQTALTALRQKRNELTFQQRMIEDEIALCDQKIQRILTGGGGDLELKIESIIECCNDKWVGNQGRMCRNLEDQCLPPCIKMKSLAEAVLITRSSLQELDSVCYENNWILPTYRVSQSDGGFQADVTVKGLNFECSCGGNRCSDPREARESAAAHMLTNLTSMQKSGQ